MLRFTQFFYLQLLLLATACNSDFNKSVEVSKPKQKALEKNQSIVLSYSEKGHYDYGRDNPMEVILWNNPIKPTTETDLFKILPEKVKIPENMAFVAGTELADTGIRIKGFFIDQFPISIQAYRYFLSQSDNKELSSTFLLQETEATKDTLLFPDWQTANAYCIWQGKRLPTKAEWTWAFSDMAQVYPTNIALQHTGKWEWLADWHLPSEQDPYIFVPDAESKKIVVRKKENSISLYELKAVDRKEQQASLTCRCVADVPTVK